MTDRLSPEAVEPQREHTRCSRCEGEGRLWADGQAHHYSETRPTKPCPNCDGTGWEEGEAPND